MCGGWRASPDTRAVHGDAAARCCAVQIPASGDGEVTVVENTTSYVTRLHYLGCKGEHKGHRVCLEIDTEGEARDTVSIADRTLRFFEAVPLVGAGIALGHTLSGNKHQAQRAAIASSGSCPRPRSVLLGATMAQPHVFPVCVTHHRAPGHGSALQFPLAWLQQPSPRQARRWRRTVEWPVPRLWWAPAWQRALPVA